MFALGAFHIYGTQYASDGDDGNGQRRSLVCDFCSGVTRVWCLFVLSTVVTGIDFEREYLVWQYYGHTLQVPVFGVVCLTLAPPNPPPPLRPQSDSSCVRFASHRPHRLRAEEGEEGVGSAEQAVHGSASQERVAPMW